MALWLLAARLRSCFVLFLVIVFCGPVDLADLSIVITFLRKKELVALLFLLDCGFSSMVSLLFLLVPSVATFCDCGSSWRSGNTSFKEMKNINILCGAYFQVSGLIDVGSWTWHDSSNVLCRQFVWEIVVPWVLDILVSKKYLTTPYCVITEWLSAGQFEARGLCLAHLSTKCSRSAVVISQCPSSVERRSSCGVNNCFKSLLLLQPWANWLETW